MEFINLKINDLPKTIAVVLKHFAFKNNVSRKFTLKGFSHKQ